MFPDRYADYGTREQRFRDRTGKNVAILKGATCRSHLPADVGRTPHELLEYAGGGMADGTVAVSFAFTDGRVTISNGPAPVLG